MLLPGLLNKKGEREILEHLSKIDRIQRSDGSVTSMLTFWLRRLDAVMEENVLVLGKYTLVHLEVMGIVSAVWPQMV